MRGQIGGAGDRAEETQGTRCTGSSAGERDMRVRSGGWRGGCGSVGRLCASAQHTALSHNALDYGIHILN